MRRTIVGVLAVLALAGCSASTKGTPASSTPATSDTPNIVGTAQPGTPIVDTPTVQPDLAPSDFTITVKITKQDCFGSAGCIIVYQINPQYMGPVDVSTGTWDVTYTVTGGDSPQINTFTMTDGEASVDSAETIQTPTTTVNLIAKATSVDVASP